MNPIRWKRLKEKKENTDAEKADHKEWALGPSEERETMCSRGRKLGALGGGVGGGVARAQRDAGDFFIVSKRVPRSSMLKRARGPENDWSLVQFRISPIQNLRGFAKAAR